VGHSSKSQAPSRSPDVMTYLAVAAVGVLVGVINGMAGGASIISYPVLLWAGLSPLSAVVTNAIGATPANFAALRAHSGRLAQVLRDNAGLTAASVTGTVVGSTLLLTAPVAVLERLIPFLLASATATLLIKPPSHGSSLSRPVETTAMFGTGVYCGYFGPGQGVMVTAVLARDGRRTTSGLNAAKNTVVGVTAMVSNTVYAFSGHVQWGYAAALGLGAAVGGLYGGRWAGHQSAAFYRGLVFAVGTVASMWLFATYY
jgi:uncharacterized membrane protein YfcA